MRPVIEFVFLYLLFVLLIVKIKFKETLCRTFAAGNKIKQFYELLVEDSLQREDVENMSRWGADLASIITNIIIIITIITIIITMLILQGEHEEPARDHAVVSLQQRLLLELPHQDHP